jgi:predicted ATPase
VSRIETIAIYIVTGFVGVCKTTLINRLLRAPEVADGTRSASTMCSMKGSQATPSSSSADASADDARRS